MEKVFKASPYLCSIISCIRTQQVYEIFLSTVKLSANFYTMKCRLLFYTNWKLWSQIEWNVCYLAKNRKQAAMKMNVGPKSSD